MGKPADNTPDPIEPVEADPAPTQDPEPEPEAPAHDWPQEVVDEVRAAETAHQRSVCQIPKGTPPKKLAEALELRVAANLAAHDGREVRRTGGQDPRVRELEAPFLRRRAAGSIDTHQKGQS